MEKSNNDDLINNQEKKKINHLNNDNINDFEEELRKIFDNNIEFINDLDENNKNPESLNNDKKTIDQGIKVDDKLKKKLTLNQENILNVLKQVIDPELNQDIVSLGFIKGIDYSQQQIHIKLQLTTPGCPLAFLIIDEIKQKLNDVFKIPVDVELVFDLGFDFDNM